MFSTKKKRTDLFYLNIVFYYIFVKLCLPRFLLPRFRVFDSGRLIFYFIELQNIFLLNYDFILL